MPHACSSAVVTLVPMLFPESDPRSRAVRRLMRTLCVILTVVLSFIAGAEISAHGYWVTRPQAPADSRGKGAAGVKSAAKAEEPLRGTDFVVIGDSYHASDTTPYHEAAEQLADLSGLTLHNYAAGGAGWLSSSANKTPGKTFGEQIDLAVADSSDFASKTAFVLVSGGYNDANDIEHSLDQSALGKEMRDGFNKLKKAFPESKIVYVPYLRANNPLLPHYFEMETVEYAITIAKKANVVVAPYAWEWNLGKDEFFDAKRDPVHPSSEEGFRYIAQKEWDIIRGKAVTREKIKKTFSGATSDGWLKYSMSIELKNGEVAGKITVVPNETVFPESKNLLEDGSDYRELTPNSSLWNAFDGQRGNLTSRVSLEISLDSSDSDDAFIISGSGAMQKGKKYTVSFHEKLLRGDWSKD